MALTIVASALRGCGGEPTAAGGTAQRVVTISPGLTEIAFALGRGDAVVGADSFSRYPAAAARLPRVGGLVDPSFERILALRPDLVLLSSASGPLPGRLRDAGVAVEVARCESLADLRRNVGRLGRLLGAEAQAAALRARVDRELEEVRRATRGRPRVRVLYVFDRQPGAVRDVFAAGRRSFLHELLELAGGENVFGDHDRGVVAVSHEMLLASAPEVLLDATRDPQGVAPWHAVRALPAVRAGRLVATGDPIFTIPGPRVGEAARRMARTLHPGALP